MAFDRQLEQFSAVLSEVRRRNAARIDAATMMLEAREKWQLQFVVYKHSSVLCEQNEVMHVQSEFLRLTCCYLRLLGDRSEIENIVDSIQRVDQPLNDDYLKAVAEIRLLFIPRDVPILRRIEEDVVSKTASLDRALRDFSKLYFKKPSTENENNVDRATAKLLYHVLCPIINAASVQVSHDKFEAWSGSLRSFASMLSICGLLDEAKMIYREWLVPKAYKLGVSQETIMAILSAEADVCDVPLYASVMNVSADQLPWRIWRRELSAEKLAFISENKRFLDQLSEPNQYFKAQAQFNSAMNEVVRKIIAYSVKLLTVELPIDFAILGTGSMARQGLIPGSDVEFAILVNNRGELNHAANAQHKLIRKCFMAIPDLADILLKAIDDEACFDSECNSSFVESHYVDDAINKISIGYVSDLCGYLERYNPNATLSEDMLVSFYPMQMACCLYAHGNAGLLLYQNYVDAIYKGWTENTALQQSQAKQLMGLHYNQWKVYRSVTIKERYISPLNFWCVDLGLYHGITNAQKGFSLSIPTLIAKLLEKNILQEETAEKILNNYAYVTALRVAHEDQLDTDKLKEVEVNCIIPLYEKVHAFLSSISYEDEQRQWEAVLEQLTDALPSSDRVSEISVQKPIHVRWAKTQLADSQVTSERLLKPVLQSDWVEKGWVDSDTGSFTEKSQRDNPGYGRRIVLLLPGKTLPMAYAKIYPELPLIQLFTQSLARRVSGYGPKSLLCQFSIGENRRETQYPVLISKPAGIVLQDAIFENREKFERIINNLDDYAYTLKVLESLLISYEDDKFDNVAAESFFNSSGVERYRLISFDCDRAFVNPLLLNQRIVDAVAIKTAKVNAKSIVFCLDKVNSPLNKEAINYFCSLDLSQLLNDWLKEAIDFDLNYDLIFSSKKKFFNKFDNSQDSNLDAAFIPGTIKELYQRFRRMQILLKKDDQDFLTSFDLLKIFETNLSVYYQQVWSRFPEVGQVVSRFAALPSNYVRVNHAKGSFSQSLSYPVQSTLFKKAAFYNILEAIRDKKHVNPLQAMSDELIPVHNHYKRSQKMSDDFVREDVDSHVKSFKENSDYLKEHVFNRITFLGKSKDFQEKIFKLFSETQFRDNLQIRHSGAITTVTLDRLLKRCWALRALEISDCGQLSSRFAQRVAQHCTSLVSLMLSDFSNAYEMSGLKFPHLRYLTLSQNTKIPLAPTRLLPKIDIDAEKLERIELSNLSIMDGIVTRSTQLESIKICGFTLLSVHAIKNIASRPYSLKAIEFKQLNKYDNFDASNDIYENDAVSQFLMKYPSLLQWAGGYLSWSFDFLNERFNGLFEKKGLTLGALSVSQSAELMSYFDKNLQLREKIDSFICIELERLVHDQVRLLKFLKEMGKYVGRASARVYFTLITLLGKTASVDVKWVLVDTLCRISGVDKQDRVVTGKFREMQELISVSLQWPDTYPHDRSPKSFKIRHPLVFEFVKLLRVEKDEKVLCALVESLNYLIFYKSSLSLDDRKILLDDILYILLHRYYADDKSKKVIIPQLAKIDLDEQTRIAKILLSDIDGVHDYSNILLETLGKLRINVSVLYDVVDRLYSISLLESGPLARRNKSAVAGLCAHFSARVPYDYSMRRENFSSLFADDLMSLMKRVDALSDDDDYIAMISGLTIDIGLREGIVDDVLDLLAQKIKKSENEKIHHAIFNALCRLSDECCSRGSSKDYFLRKIYLCLIRILNSNCADRLKMEVVSKLVSGQLDHIEAILFEDIMGERGSYGSFYGDILTPSLQNFLYVQLRIEGSPVVIKHIYDALIGKYCNPESLHDDFSSGIGFDECESVLIDLLSLNILRENDLIRLFCEKITQWKRDYESLTPSFKTSLIKKSLDKRLDSGGDVSLLFDHDEKNPSLNSISSESSQALSRNASFSHLSGLHVDELDDYPNSEHSPVGNELYHRRSGRQKSIRNVPDYMVGADLYIANKYHPSQYLTPEFAYMLNKHENLIRVFLMLLPQNGLDQKYINELLKSGKSYDSIRKDVRSVIFTRTNEQLYDSYDFTVSVHEAIIVFVANIQNFSRKNKTAQFPVCNAWKYESIREKLYDKLFVQSQSSLSDLLQENNPVARKMIFNALTAMDLMVDEAESFLANLLLCIDSGDSLDCDDIIPVIDNLVAKGMLSPLRIHEILCDHWRFHAHSQTQQSRWLVSLLLSRHMDDVLFQSLDALTNKFLSSEQNIESTHRFFQSVSTAEARLNYQRSGSIELELKSESRPGLGCCNSN